MTTLVTREEAERTGMLQTVWDRLPSREELGNFFVPGVEYLWCLHRNQPKAEDAEGWRAIQMRAPGRNNPWPLPRFQVRGQDVVLLAQGTPIPGAAPDSCGIPVRIDPELADILDPPPAPPKAEAPGDEKPGPKGPAAKTGAPTQPPAK